MRHLKGRNLFEDLDVFLGLCIQKEEDVAVDTNEAEDDDDECVEGRENIEPLENENLAGIFGEC